MDKNRDVVLDTEDNASTDGVTFGSGYIAEFQRMFDTNSRKFAFDKDEEEKMDM